MWGGRFATGPDALLLQINASITFDQRLFREDIRASRAHARMLCAQKILSDDDCQAILTGLDQVEEEFATGQIPLDPALEDVHMHVEQRLADLIGPAAGRLHTARSRNDQVATDFRLWLRGQIDVINGAYESLLQALVDRAEAYFDLPMPGYTHLQVAQPVTLGHHLLAHAEAFHRDRGRLQDARKRLNESPLGSAALAGTGFPIDRQHTAEALGFDRIMENSMDAVASRDFALEFLATASISALHLSRLAEELVIFLSQPFGFFYLSDRFTTGSSIMPQKRNPDAAELLRGKSGRVLGAFVTLATVMKGLPLTYSKDMQEDKEPVFDATSTLLLSLEVMAGMIHDLTPNPERMKAALEHGFPTATDLADHLVRTANVPFREAHELVAHCVGLADQTGRGLSELTQEELEELDPRLGQDLKDVLSIEGALRRRISVGGTAPDQVRQAVVRARQRFALK